jgi:hypothetical protein
MSADGAVSDMSRTRLDVFTAASADVSYGSAAGNCAAGAAAVSILRRLGDRALLRGTSVAAGKVLMEMIDVQLWSDNLPGNIPSGNYCLRFIRDDASVIDLEVKREGLVVIKELIAAALVVS